MGSKKTEKKLNKGDFGYLKYKKRLNYVYIFLIYGLAAAIFIVGYLLSKYAKNNIATVIALLVTIPAAKMVVNAVLMCKFKPIDEKFADNIKEVAAGRKVLFDLVITSKEKAMHISSMVITKHMCILFVKKDQNAVCKYVQDYLAARKITRKVKVYNEMDKYLKDIASDDISFEEEVDEIVRKIMILHV